MSDLVLFMSLSFFSDIDVSCLDRDDRTKLLRFQPDVRADLDIPGFGLLRLRRSPPSLISKVFSRHDVLKIKYLEKKDFNEVNSAGIRSDRSLVLGATPCLAPHGHLASVLCSPGEIGHPDAGSESSSGSEESRVVSSKGESYTEPQPRAVSFQKSSAQLPHQAKLDHLIRFQNLQLVVASNRMARKDIS